MNKTTVSQQAKSASFLPPAQGILQRKCACGNHTVAGGRCAECTKNKSGFQRKLTIGSSNDPLEREADHVADKVVANSTASSPVSSLAFGRLQREDVPKEKTNEEKYKEGLEKLGEAFLKTPLGKELLEKIKQDALVEGGKNFISTWPGKIVTGVAATGAVAALAATHKELPAQIPEIPLDVLTPGLSVQLTYKGPVDKPTEAMITFKFTEQKASSADKRPMNETDKFRAETARLAAADAKFRAGMTYTPGSPEDLQQKAEQAALRRAVLQYSSGPDIEATIKKYPWLATPQPKSGLQLTMPKPSFGIQPPSLLGNEFKLKPPDEQKKKQDEPELQKKLSIGASNDPLEQEADRIADQVLATPARPTASDAPLRIQRFAGQATGDTGTTPASVDHVLASSGRPLEPALRHDMEQRFGHDFSRVRVHSDEAAKQSAREVNAHAYTVGHDIVFGAGQFAPGTHEGRRLLAHELTHVVQQHGARVAHMVDLGRAGNTDQQKAEDMTFPMAWPVSTPVGFTTTTVGRVQRQFITPLGAGGGFGGLMERDRERASGADESRPTVPQGQVADEGNCNTQLCFLPLEVLVEQGVSPESAYIAAVHAYIKWDGQSAGFTRVTGERIGDARVISPEPREGKGGKANEPRCVQIRLRTIPTPTPGQLVHVTAPGFARDVIAYGIDVYSGLSQCRNPTCRSAKQRLQNMLVDDRRGLYSLFDDNCETWARNVLSACCMQAPLAPGGGYGNVAQQLLKETPGGDLYHLARLLLGRTRPMPKP